MYHVINAIMNNIMSTHQPGLQSKTQGEEKKEDEKRRRGREGGGEEKVRTIYKIVSKFYRIDGYTLRTKRWGQN